MIGLKRNPDQTSEEHRTMCADEILGLDKLEYAIKKADFVVGVLPKTEHTNHFFNKDVFKIMKPGSIFMNVGRGSTVNEIDLI